MSVPTDLLTRVLELPQAERAELAHHLLLSLEPEGPERDAGYEEAWAAELNRRIDDVDRGNVETGSLFEILDEIRKELRESRDA